MKDLIIEARELHAGWMAHESIHHGGGQGAKSDDGEMSRKFMFWLVDDFPELCDALEKAQEQMPRWIPVTERLPTGRGYYLSVVERIAPDELGGNNTRVKIMRWLGEDWRYPLHIPEWINETITETVTHWMPLPEPPEEGVEHERD